MIMDMLILIVSLCVYTREMEVDYPLFLMCVHVCYFFVFFVCILFLLIWISLWSNAHKLNKLKFCQQRVTKRTMAIRWSFSDLFFTFSISGACPVVGYFFISPYFTALFSDLFSSHWCRRSSCHGWITVMDRSSASRCASLSDYSQWLILLPGWCFPRRGSTTSPRSSASCTGSKYRSGLTISSPFSSTSVCRV